MIEPMTSEEFALLAGQGSHVAVFKEIMASKLSPVMIYSLLNKKIGEGIILEDLYKGSSPYSFICFELISTFTANEKEDSPLTALREFQAQFRITTRKEVAELITSSA